MSIRTVVIEIKRNRDAIAVLTKKLDAVIKELERLKSLLGPEDEIHLIEFRAESWIIKHPISCRPNLFNCPVNRAATSDILEWPSKLGMYACYEENGNFVIGDPQ